MQTYSHHLLPKSSHLAIRIGKQSLSFATTVSQEEDYPMFEPYGLRSGISIAANLREAFRESALLSENVKYAVVLYDAPVVWIPTEEFVEAKKERLYRYVAPLNENEETLHYIMPDLNAAAVFAVNKDAKLVLTDRIADVSFMPAMQPVWRYAHRRNFKNMNGKLYVCFQEKQMNVFCFNKHHFKFTNCFNVSTAADAIYYMMHVWKTLGLDEERDELHLMGDILEQDWCMEHLHRYVQKVYAVNPLTEFYDVADMVAKGIPFDLLTYLMAH